MNDKLPIKTADGQNVTELVQADRVRAFGRGHPERAVLMQHSMDFMSAKSLYLFSLRMSSRSENTIRSARQALNLIPSIAVMDELDEDLLQRVLADAVAPATYNRYRSALVSFFDFCVARGFASRNPARALPTRRLVEQGHLILTPRQMLDMLNEANPAERIALAIGMNTALRASDVVALKLGAVDMGLLTLKTKITKTGSYDEKPITNQLLGELQIWLTRYGSLVELDPDSFLVPSYTMLPPGAPRRESGPLIVRPTMPLTHPHRIVQRGLERIGMPTEGQGFHTLRRSSARALFEKLREESSYDHALMVVKEFLNHKSVEQTQVYLGLNHERAIRDELLRGKDFLV